MTTITQDTPLDPAAYRALAIAKGLRFYARTGMKPNAAYTPTAMMTAANEITGCNFGKRKYEQAALALEQWVHNRVAERSAALLAKGTEH